MSTPEPGLTGILLAAGRGARFDPSGGQNKLMQPLAGGELVAAAAAKHMLAVLPDVVAVVRPGAVAVESQLRSAGCDVTQCPNADQGMGVSLVHALSRRGDASGWIIALADMPHVQPATIQALAEALRQGADIAVPTYRKQRGNPVAFSRSHLAQLLQLSGDRGARSLLLEFPVTEIAVDDAGILRDIDTPADLSASTGRV
jgi:molybdenum cofactor cytidylyltransferase